MLENGGRRCCHWHMKPMSGWNSLHEAVTLTSTGCWHTSSVTKKCADASCWRLWRILRRRADTSKRRSLLTWRAIRRPYGRDTWRRARSRQNIRSLRLDKCKPCVLAEYALMSACQGRVTGLISESPHRIRQASEGRTHFFGFEKASGDVLRYRKNGTDVEGTIWKATVC